VKPSSHRSSALALVAAIALDHVVGDPRRLHPVAGFGRLAQSLERTLWRSSRLSGACYAGLLVASSAASVAAAERLLRRRSGARTTFAVVVVWSTLGGGSLWRCARALGVAVAAGDLDRARKLAPTLVGRDPTRLDEPELCRAAIESVAENTTDAVIAPLLWFAVCGAPAAAAYRAANTLDAMVGHHSERYAAFGWASARLDDVLTWPCARIASALTVALAPLAGGSRGDALRALACAREHPSPNAGLIEAAFAGALGVRLGGSNDYGHRVEERPTFGTGDPPRPADIERAVRLSQVVTVAAVTTTVAALVFTR
jgi:adenosylcobinamide-phosphate synthase